MMRRTYYFLALSALVGIVLGLKYQIVRVSQNSMLPTLKDGSIAIFERSDGRSPVTKKDVGRVVLAWRQDRDQYIVKRLVALEGDAVLLTDQQTVLVNGVNVSRNVSGARGNVVVRIIVPKGYAYLLGDNPAESTDSRYFGVIQVNSILGVKV